MRLSYWLILLFLFPFVTSLPSPVMAQSCPPNIDFEMGNFDGWTCYTGYTAAIGGRNEITFTAGPPQAGRHSIVSASSTAQLDPYGKFPVNCPNGSGHSIMLGNEYGGHEADGVSYEFTIPAGQNSYSLIYHYAVVFQQPRHEVYEQPRMEIEVLNMTDNTVVGCASFTFIAYGSSLPGFMEADIEDSIPVLYKDWTAVSVDLSGNAGKKFRLLFKTADCTFNRHFGYAYIDINSECDGKLTGAEYCPNDTAVNIVAPFGYAGYAWYNETQTNILGNDQTLTLDPPPPPNTIFAVRLTPYAGFGCDQTLMVKLANTLTVRALAGPDTVVCNQVPVRLGSPPKPGLVYTWDPPDGLSNAYSSNPFATPSKPTTYYLTARNSGGGCMSLDTVVVKASVLNDTLRLLGKAEYCLGTGDSAVLLVAPTDSIRWFRNSVAVPGAHQTFYKPSSTGSYHALLRNNDGCSLSTLEKNISIASIPTVGFSVGSLAQCLTGNRFVLNNSSSNAVGTMQYRWTMGDGMSYATQHPSHSYSRAGKYNITLIVNSSAVCADTASAAIEVFQNAVADFSVKPVCIGLPLQIVNHTADTLQSPVHYRWVFGNGQTSTLDSPIAPVYTTAGNYAVSLAVHTDQCSSPPHVMTQVVAVDKPRPGITYPVQYALINTPLLLRARAIGETALWMPASNLDNNKSFTPLFTGLLEQQYQVTITTASGCVTVDTQMVKTVKDVVIHVPTAFTPNSDGRNDLLRPTVFGIKQLNYFRVFNRWGQLVFQTTAEGVGWDGRLGGLPQATQTYVWMAEAIGADNKIYKARGTSVLVR